MDRQFEQHEREIDRQLADLAPHLDGPAPRREHIAAIKDLVALEAGRLRGRQRRLVALRPLIGAAAALLLTVGLSLPFGSSVHRATFTVDDDPEMIFGDWVDALDETGERFTRLFDDNWYLNVSGSKSDANTEVRDSLDSLEESLESFEGIIGA
jgi:hypothetical protein